MEIKKVNHLREFIAEQLNNLIKGKIKPEQANSCAMLAANMLFSVRLEIEYNKLKGEKPDINFMETNNKTLEGTVIKRIKND